MADTQIALFFNETKAVDERLALPESFINEVVNRTPDVQVPANPFSPGYSLRAKARELIGAVLPVAKLQFSTLGDCPPTGITIDGQLLQVLDNDGIQVEAFGFGVSVMFTAQIAQTVGIKKDRIEDCTGLMAGLTRRVREFTLHWYARVVVNPGPSVNREIEGAAENFIVSTPCCPVIAAPGAPGTPPLPSPGDVTPPPEEGEEGAKDGNLKYGDARYEKRTERGPDGRPVTRYFICVRVDNCGDEEALLCVDFGRLDVGFDPTDPLGVRRLVSYIGEQQVVRIAPRRMGAFGEIRGSVDICPELPEPPRAGDTYEIALGTVKGPDGRLDRGNIANILKQITIDRP